MNRNLNNVLNMLERKLLESARLMENEEFMNAKRIILEARSNLLRVRMALNPATFDSIKICFDNLLEICYQNAGEDERVNHYVAPQRRSGGRGRPQIIITENQLKMLVQENYSTRQMAYHFGCSVQLIYKKCYSFGIKIRDKYFRGNEEDLYREIYDLHTQFPNSGSQMMAGYLRSRGKVVQRQKIRAILTEIDPVGTASRWSNSIQRRTYKVPTPNALWHMDAHLKLIRWKFAIHGCIDGYSRLIVYLNCSTSMTAGSVINFFAQAANEYGLPSRVRSDFGYENLFVAMVMNVVRGINRNSHITGRSVHNQRIERLWVDVIKEVVEFFDHEFTDLEDSLLLEIDDSRDLFALQKVYVIYINNKLNCFKNAWNSHQIRTERHRTPRQLWLSGMLENCNSRYTAPNEVFHDQPDLYTRIVDAFELEDANIPVITQDQETVSNLTIQIELSDDEHNFITRIMEDVALDYRAKYIRIRTYLRDM